MKIGDEIDLMYSSNVRGEETWEQIFSGLKRNIPIIKNSCCPNQSFGIGLRLSAEAAEVLLTENHLEDFKSWLDDSNCFVLSINGFSYSENFNSIIKDEIYKPDWTTDFRLQYSLDLINICAELIPDNFEKTIGITTTPISYKPWIKDPKQLDFILKSSCFHLIKCVEEMVAIRKSTGKFIHLDLKPEPSCLIENSMETVFFFKNYLLPFGANYFNDKHALTKEESTKIITDHIQICFDSGNFAVEFEEPVKAITNLKEGGINIGKILISSILKVESAEKSNREIYFLEYSKFSKSKYLQQTIAKDINGKSAYFTDLPLALNNFKNENFKEWRTNSKLPVFMPKYKVLNSTQENVLELLSYLKKTKLTELIEVETYFSEVLKDETIHSNECAIKEIDWVINQLC